MFARISAVAARRTSGWIGIIVPALYAGIVIAVTVLVAAVLLFADDPGFIAIWLVFVTFPLSGVSLTLAEMVGELPEPLDMTMFFVATTGVGLLQAWLLRLLVRGRRVPVSG